MHIIVDQWKNKFGSAKDGDITRSFDIKTGVDWRDSDLRAKHFESGML